MAEPNATPEPGDGTLPTANVIRLIQGAEESNQDRLMKKYLPAFVVSGAAHVIVLVAAILGLPANASTAKPSDEIITAVAPTEEKDEKTFDLTNPDEGLDSSMKAAVEVDRLAEQNVEAKVTPDDVIGVAGAENTPPMDTPSLAGVGADLNNLGIAGDAGSFLAGAGGNAGVAVSKAMSGRSGATKDLMVKAGGGSDKSEAAVAKGLAWLAKEQKADGSWKYDGDAAADAVAATGMALLPFLAAGNTHKVKESKYQSHVEKGINFLLKNQKPDGSFNGIMPNHQMYSHAIATVALCECLGMTGDRGKLLSPVQKATNFILAGQGNNGSWGYRAKTEGDTSIVGWQIQALKSAEMCKDVQIDKKALAKATKFLNDVSGGSAKSTYGYRNGPGQAATGLTAVGLLCRYYLDGWGPLNPGMAEGVKQMNVRRPPAESQFDMYYYYYATQVVHFHEGEAWHKEWNPKMRELLVKLQVAGKTEKTNGSWDADRATIGGSCGRLGTTCMALLTLEVYYRHLPLYKRGTGGMQDLERGK